jgi:CubicO group peptidase (beta-lactamase class C family)
VAEPLGLGLQGDVIAAIVPDRARPYDLGARPGEAAPAGGGEVRNAQPVNPAYKWAGGGMVATPTDLAKLGAALIRPGYLKAASLKRMLTPLAPASGKVQVPVGMAWRVDVDRKGRRRFHHAGNIAGGRAAVIVYPDLALAIAMAANFTPAMPDPMTPAAELADLFAA